MGTSESDHHAVGRSVALGRRAARDTPLWPLPQVARVVKQNEAAERAVGLDDREARRVDAEAAVVVEGQSEQESYENTQGILVRDYQHIPVASAIARPRQETPKALRGISNGLAPRWGEPQGIDVPLRRQLRVPRQHLLAGQALPFADVDLAQVRVKDQGHLATVEHQPGRFGATREVTGKGCKKRHVSEPRSRLARLLPTVLRKRHVGTALIAVVRGIAGQPVRLSVAYEVITESD